MLVETNFCFVLCSSGTLPPSAGVTIVILLLLAFFSLLLALGVYSDIRGLIFPWYFTMIVVVLFQVSIFRR